MTKITPNQGRGITGLVPIRPAQPRSNIHPPTAFSPQHQAHASPQQPGSGAPDAAAAGGRLSNLPRPPMFSPNEDLKVRMFVLALEKIEAEQLKIEAKQCQLDVMQKEIDEMGVQMGKMQQELDELQRQFNRLQQQQGPWNRRATSGAPLCQQQVPNKASYFRGHPLPTTGP